MDAELYCIPNDVEFVSLTVDADMLTKASMSSTVELIFTSCQDKTQYHNITNMVNNKT